MTRRRSILGAGGSLTGLLLVSAAGADPARRLAPRWPPAGHSVRIAVTRDAWVSAVGEEREGNNGGSRRLKLKGFQEMALFDADLSALKGRRITGALLHLRCASLDAPLRRVSVSTIATPWEEVDPKAPRQRRMLGQA